MSGDNREGVRQGSNDADPPVFQSRLRAKREERMLQRQLEQEVAHIPASAVSRSLESNAKAALRNDPGAPSAAKDAGITPHGFAHRPMVEVGDEAVKRRERAEARKRVIEYQGNVWDAVCSNDLKMVQSYFLVEGAQNLLRRRHPNAEQGGRSLLHCAAWHGCAPIVEFILSAGCAVDAIDSAASKTTALLEAARAGHAAVGTQHFTGLGAKGMAQF
ncbi:hypothetical protein PHYBOEH_008575 [Phytophthora boehmeriae]|uniref:Uncharacterized protein n=1 Tax=Phytophthora boehmeriae TaxID=109152 RepID=A0A8T1X7V2_9STRA|nr:hypothetical protein PHYBOEH_008575 [Phytophthora boehmeriae]